MLLSSLEKMTHSLYLQKVLSFLSHFLIFPFFTSKKHLTAIQCLWSPAAMHEKMCLSRNEKIRG